MFFFAYLYEAFGVRTEINASVFVFVYKLQSIWLINIISVDYIFQISTPRKTL